MRKLSLLEISLSDKFQNFNDDQAQVANWLIMHEADGKVPSLTDLIVLGTSDGDIPFIQIVAQFDEDGLLDGHGYFCRGENVWR